ncbi:MAG: hypothetical protein GY742_03095 [Hyphomicrobiales bacterium]|nr:hypothetical protein [Hyphomicrobiales bacterium]
MQKTHKEMIVESDDHSVMDLEIIDDAGNMTEIKARAVNIKHKSARDILVTALPKKADGKIAIITSVDPDEKISARLVTYHSSANIMNIDVKLHKIR